MVFHIKSYKGFENYAVSMYGLDLMGFTCLPLFTVVPLNEVD